MPKPGADGLQRSVGTTPAAIIHTILQRGQLLVDTFPVTRVAVCKPKRHPQKKTSPPQLLSAICPFTSVEDVLSMQLVTKSRVFDHGKIRGLNQEDAIEDYVL